MMAHATWHVACGALWSLEKSVDDAHDGDALDAPYGVLEVKKDDQPAFKINGQRVKQYEDGVWTESHSLQIS